MWVQIAYLPKYVLKGVVSGCERRSGCDKRTLTSRRPTDFNISSFLSFTFSWFARSTVADISADVRSGAQTEGFHMSPSATRHRGHGARLPTPRMRAIMHLVNVSLEFSELFFV